MSKLRKMAKKFANEMIRHNLKHGAAQLDMEFIAKQACDLAYAIDKNINEYEKANKVLHYQHPPL